MVWLCDRFLWHLLTNVVKLESVGESLKKLQHAYHRSNIPRSGQSCGYNSLIGNYLSLIVQSYVADFDSAFKVLKLLCKFEKQLEVASGESGKLTRVEFFPGNLKFLSIILSIFPVCL